MINFRFVMDECALLEIKLSKMNGETILCPTLPQNSESAKDIV